MPTPPISDEELERYRECLQRKIDEGYAPLGRRSHLGSALESAADELRANSGSLHKLIRRGRIKLDTANWEPPDRALDVPQPPRQSDDLERALDRERRRLETERVTEARVWREIHRLSEPTPEPPDWTISGHLGGSSPGLPVTIWSDWHWGETINPDEVGGVNIFDIPTAHERVRRLIERTIDVCQHHMVTPDYPGVVVCLGGDMITGEIHPELAATNDADLMPTLVDLESTLIWALDQMVDAFGRVFVPCVTGNHGRMDVKPRHKRRAVRSYEWLAYSHVAAHFRQRYGDNGPVRFQIPQSTDAHFGVFGRRYMLTHGDTLGVRGGDGIIGVLGPIIRGKVKAQALEAQIGRDVDVLLMGHYHRYLPIPSSGVIVNGCLCGYSEYARTGLRAPYERPQQALWFVHPKWGEVLMTPIILDDPRAAPQTEWVSWAA